MIVHNSERNLLCLFVIITHCSFQILTLLYQAHIIFKVRLLVLIDCCSCLLESRMWRFDERFLCLVKLLSSSVWSFHDICLSTRCQLC